MLQYLIMLKLITTLLIFILCINSVLAHVCDDVLRHDPINIRTDTQVVRVLDKGEFKIFLKNNYVDTIHNVKVIIPENLFDFKVTPDIIEQVKSGQEVHFLVRVAVSKDIEQGTYPLVLKVSASEFAVAREIQVTIKLEKEDTIVEIQPRDIPLAVSAARDIIEVEPSKSIEFKVFMRHGHTNSIHNAKLLIGNKFEVNVTPVIIEEIKPSETTYFLLTLKVPENMREGDYLIPIEVSADEFPVRYGTSITIRVGKIREELTYLYFLLIIILIGFLVLRKIKR